MKNKIYSVDDAIESVYNIGLERGEVLFRGQVNYEWEVTPSIFRHKEFEIANKYEAVLFEYLLSGIHSAYTLSFDPIEHLILLQHFDIHTRLLDWTSDVLIALFFSCFDFNSSYNDIDGNVIMIQRNQYPSYNMNNKDKRIFKFPPKEKEQIESFKKRLSIDKLYVLEPLIKNPRMRNQDGAFMFFPFLPLLQNEKKFVSLHSYMRARNEIIRKSNAESHDKEEQLIWIANKVVDSNSKSSILKELDEKYGINYPNLFVGNDFVFSQKKYFEQIRNRADEKLEWLLEKAKTENF